MSTPATRPQIEAVLDEFRVVIRYPDLTVCSPSGAQELAAAYVEARATIARLEGERDRARRILDATAGAVGFARTYDPSTLPAFVAHTRARADAAERRVEAVKELRNWSKGVREKFNLPSDPTARVSADRYWDGYQSALLDVDRAIDTALTPEKA